MINRYEGNTGRVTRMPEPLRRRERRGRRPGVPSPRRPAFCRDWSCGGSCRVLPTDWRRRICFCC